MTDDPKTTQARPKVAVSACLLGEGVRFDGGHKRHRFVCDELSDHFEFVSICPEVGIGLGTPRGPIRLVHDAAEPQATRTVFTDDPDRDITEQLLDYGTRMAASHGDLAGYILKSQSPSCGMERVRVYGQGGGVSKDGIGTYVRGFRVANGLIPMEEEGRLTDSWLREQFIVRVLAYHEWLQLCATGPKLSRLMSFHQRHKLELRAHDPEACRRLGRMLAEEGHQLPADELAISYIEGFMTALRKQSREKRHASVMERLVGRLRGHLDDNDRGELLDSIQGFRTGVLPMLVPLTLLRHHINRRDRELGRQNDSEQYYLAPHPRELRLRKML